MIVAIILSLAIIAGAYFIIIRDFIIIRKKEKQQPTYSIPSTGWEIGPIINGQTYSPGMPTSTPDGSFEFPVGFASEDYRSIPSVHYVTKPTGSLVGKSGLTLVFEIIGDGFKATQPEGDVHPRLRLFIQRGMDNWSNEGPYEHFRWWSRDYVDLEPGVHTIFVPLTGEAWSSIMGKGGNDVPELFQASLNEAVRVGMTFGAGYAGHGVYATAPGVRFVLKSFDTL